MMKKGEFALLLLIASFVAAWTAAPDRGYLARWRHRSEPGWRDHVDCERLCSPQDVERRSQSHPQGLQAQDSPGLARVRTRPPTVA